MKMEQEILKLAYEGALNRLDYYHKRQQECIEVYGHSNKIYTNLIMKYETLYKKITRKMIHS